MKRLEEVYGPDFAANTSMITMAPELPGALDVIKTLTDDHDITVAIGMYAHIRPKIPRDRISESDRHFIGHVIVIS